MIRFVLAVAFFLMAGSTNAQDHNLLIRSDDSQPFFARLGEQTYNSSANGSLTIPGIQENTISLVIGFPGGRYPEQNFSIVLKTAEMSFLLKKNDGNRWMLQSNPESKKQGVNPSGFKKQDAFSILMAGVVNDTAVLYNTAQQEEPSKDTVAVAPRPTTTAATPPVAGTTKSRGRNQPVKKPGGKKATVVAGTATVAATSTNSSQKAADSVKDANNANNSQAWIAGIFKVYEKKLGTALKMIYVDVSEQGKIDSVDMQIVYETESTPTPGINPEKTVRAGAQENSSGTNPSSSKPVVQDEKKTGVAVIATQGANKKQDSIVVVKKEPVKKADTVLTKPATTQKTVVNSNCRELATEYDEDKIRVKMMGQPSDDDKVTEARKFFKQKCYSVKQLRNLSEVFPQDEGRYKFFDAAYPYVSDSENFNQLQALLIDPYYINRFKAMLKNN